MLGGLLLLMSTGMPVAFCFILMDVIGVFLFWGGAPGLRQLTLSMYDSLASFTTLPVIAFILMGEVMFLSGVASMSMDALDKWLGRVPGRLSLLAVAAGTVLVLTSGSSIATTALLGSVLVPEMEKRGYKKAMSLGPIMGSGGLAMMIPPSAIGVLVAAIGQFSIGKLLIAIIVPGFLMAFIYAIYIISRCWLQPYLAPPYDVAPAPLIERAVDTVRYVLPLVFIIFLVLGLVFLGIATPTEAGALGAIGCYILAACYRRLNWQVVKKSLFNTIEVTLMILMLLAGATAFSQLLASTGAARGMTEVFISLPLPPILIIAAMQVVALILGMFMANLPIMLITLPIFMPIVYSLGFDPVWFGAMLVLNMEIGCLTPPYGWVLFTMKGVASPSTTMGDVYQAAMPFVYLDLIVMVSMLVFPSIVLWLPNLMR